MLEEFVKKMDWVRNSALKWLDENGRVEMKPLTATQQEEYDNTKTCWLCGKGYNLYMIIDFNGKYHFQVDFWLILLFFLPRERNQSIILEMKENT